MLSRLSKQIENLKTQVEIITNKIFYYILILTEKIPYLCINLEKMIVENIDLLGKLIFDKSTIAIDFKRKGYSHVELNTASFNLLPYEKNGTLKIYQPKPEQFRKIKSEDIYEIGDQVKVKQRRGGGGSWFNKWYG